MTGTPATTYVVSVFESHIGALSDHQRQSQRWDGEGDRGQVRLNCQAEEALGMNIRGC